jgi:hypothetical protein
MKLSIKKVLSATIALCVATQPAQAALLTLASQPIYLGAAIPPQVMLTMTKDQQLPPLNGIWISGVLLTSSYGERTS